MGPLTEKESILVQKGIKQEEKEICGYWVSVVVGLPGHMVMLPAAWSCALALSELNLRKKLASE